MTHTKNTGSMITDLEMMQETIRECFIGYVTTHPPASYFKLGLKVGLSEQALKDFISKRTTPTMRTLTTIAKFLDKEKSNKVKELYNG